MSRYVYLDYIKSNSKQYLPTDIMITQDDDIEVDIQFSKLVTSGSSNTIFDTRVSSGGPRIMLEMNASRIYYSNGVSNNAYVSGIPAEALLTRMTLRLTKAGRLLIDGADQGRQTSGTFGSYPIVFFGCQLDGHQDLTESTDGENNRLLWSDLKFYGCNIIRNGEIIHSLKPAYDKQIGECGLYDENTGVFYANMDTTETKEDFEHPDIPLPKEHAIPLGGNVAPIDFIKDVTNWSYDYDSSKVKSVVITPSETLLKVNVAAKITAASAYVQKDCASIYSDKQYNLFSYNGIVINGTYADSLSANHPVTPYLKDVSTGEELLLDTIAHRNLPYGYCLIPENWKKRKVTIGFKFATYIQKSGYSLSTYNYEMSEMKLI